MVHQNPALPSVIQALWDEVGESSGAMIILCGSVISELDRLRQGSEPLYGRFTGVHRIRPFSFEQASLFFPGKDLEHRVSFYGVLGGMPMYLNLASSYENLWRLIEQEILDPMKILYEEVPLLLSKELREPAKFMSILELVARGITMPAQIGANMQMSTSILSHYLAQLVEMDLLERQVPVTEKSSEKSRRGTYALNDCFVRFWFRFLVPYRQQIEAGETARVLGIVKRDFDTFVGPVAEEVARQAVRSANSRVELPARFESVGGYWNRNSEIDICGTPLDGGPYLWGECRWRRRMMSTGDLRALESKVTETRIESPGDRIYILCSRSGFTKGLTDEAKARDDVRLWGLDDIDRFSGGGRTWQNP